MFKALLYKIKARVGLFDKPNLASHVLVDFIWQGLQNQHEYQQTHAGSAVPSLSKQISASYGRIRKIERHR